MWHFTNVANWFDDRKAASDQVLDQWVENSQYDGGVMIVAATTHALTTFRASFVDVLRLGDGITAGGFKGWGADAMRFIAIFPVGKAANLIKNVKGTAAAKLIADTGGPNCFWIASSKALRQIGLKSNGKFFISVEDLAGHLECPWRIFGESLIWPRGMSYLQRVGAKVGAVKSLASAQDIGRMVPSDGSILMLAVKVVNKNRVIGGHAIYAYKDIFGRLRFFGRTVGALFGTTTRGVFTSVEEIARYYGATAIIPYEGAVLSNIYLKTVGFELPKLAIPIMGAIGEHRS